PSMFIDHPSMFIDHPSMFIDHPSMFIADQRAFIGARGAGQASSAASVEHALEGPRHSPCAATKACAADHEGLVPLDDAYFYVTA
ncbi:MAG: hypothetical protein ACREJ3_05605, partial [Polyangiaceae bacterium]